MKKRVYKFITVLVLCIMVGVSVFAVIKKNNFIPKNNLWNKASTSNVGQSSSEEEVDITEGIVPSVTGGNYYYDGIISMRPGRTTNLHNPIEFKFVNYYNESEVYCDLEFTPNWFCVSKDRKIDLKYFADFDYMKIDAQGTLICDKSYYTANITVKNLADETGEFCFNNLRLYSFQNDGTFETGGECFEYDAKDSRNSKDFFLYIFEPHEERTINLVFYIDDSMANNISKSTIIFNQDNMSTQFGTFAFLDFYE